MVEDVAPSHHMLTKNSVGASYITVMLVFLLNIITQIYYFLNMIFRMVPNLSTNSEYPDSKPHGRELFAYNTGLSIIVGHKKESYPSFLPHHL